MFLACYTLVLTTLYSAIPYKTPWCLLSFLQAMAVLAGVGAWSLLRGLPAALKAVAAVLLAAGLAHLGRECYQLNFNPRFFADLRNPYVYAHTSTDLLDLARADGTSGSGFPRRPRPGDSRGHARELLAVALVPAAVQSRPLGMWNDPARWTREARQLPPPAVIMLTSESQAEVDAHLRGDYNRQMMYGLRPGVVVMVYVREDLWQAFLKAVAGDS